MKTTSIFLALAAILLVAPSLVEAGEIQYGSLKSQHGDTLLLEYKGPTGAQYFTCTTDNQCSSKGNVLPTILPSLLGSKTYKTSADGTLAVKPFSVGTLSYNFLYDISGEKPKKLALIPYTKTSATVHFAKNNNAIVFQEGTTFTRYDITTKKISTLKLNQQLSFLQISPSATYVTGYNYNTLKHELWKFADGKLTYGPSSMQSYFEFSGDESRVAFLEDKSGYRTLFTMSANDLGKSVTPSLRQLTKPNTETEDYLFVGTNLYFMANVDGPLEWDLFSYDGTAISSVDTDVSYGDFLKLVRAKGDSYLAYLKTVGKNTNVVLHSPKLSKATTLTPIKDSPASTNITREVKEYGGSNGVLLSPKKVTSKGGNLFIWMHGGPMRQVAKGYHPYLSYAVYDELLERLVDGGNYVYKIDYSGSTGYGAEFKKALDMKIGSVEMKEVANAIKEIKADKKITNVYLIGNSYGGYMALRGIVDTPKTLAGAISINGVSDWYGLIQQIPTSPFKDLFNGVPDTHNLDAYLQASVFTGMEKLSKDDKVLVVWGERDSTVPVSQSTKYVDYAKTKNVNVSTLKFPDEEHIIRDRKNLNTLCKSIVSTFDIPSVSCKI
ncbi:TPA: hypothetical protein DEP58_04225 [Patescibacteria group bacterium]|nr:MAG: Peptidase S9 prolyl oligopeptidase active site domain protein [Parcubacteria group bacterium GW2011_GWD2_42_14]HCC05481.1 hypothetical protein [Patescibacteria group bacterium]